MHNTAVDRQRAYSSSMSLFRALVHLSGVVKACIKRGALASWLLDYAASVELHIGCLFRLAVHDLLD